MKFGKRMIEDLMEPGWESYYVEYHALKKVIVQVIQAHGTPHETVLVQLFFNRLNGNIRRAEAFADSTLQTISEKKVTIAARVSALKHITQDKRTGAEQTLDEFVSWGESVQALSRFCITNRTAARKSVKKLQKNTTLDVSGKEEVGFQVFKMVEEKLAELVRTVKDLELKLMVACTEYSMMIRARKAARSMEVERLKLRRVEHFELDFLRSFVEPQAFLPELYLELRPLHVLFVSVVGSAIVVCCSVPPSSVVPLPDASENILLQLVMENLDFVTLPVACLSGAGLLGSVFLQHLLLSAKLRSMKLKRHGLHTFSFCVAMLYLSLTWSRLVVGSCQRVTVHCQHAIGLTHLVVELFLQVRHDLVCLFPKALRGLFVVGFSSLVVVDWTMVSSKGRNASYEDLVVRIGYVCFLAYCLTFAFEFRQLHLEAQVRRRTSPTS